MVEVMPLIELIIVMVDDNNDNNNDCGDATWDGGFDDGATGCGC